MNFRFGTNRSAMVGIVVILLGLLFVACGSDNPDPTAPPATVPAPTATQPPAPTAPPTIADVGTGGEVDLVTLGEDVFLRSAGGIGCQTCHGEDASGTSRLRSLAATQPRSSALWAEWMPWLSYR